MRLILTVVGVLVIMLILFAITGEGIEYQVDGVHHTFHVGRPE